MKETLYQILGIPEDADEQQVRSAYRLLAKRYHPDAGEGSSAARFRAVRDAYDILSDPGRRSDYDRTLHPALYVRRFPDPVFARAGTRAAHVDLRHLATRGPEMYAPRQSSEEAGDLLKMLALFRFFDEW